MKNLIAVFAMILMFASTAFAEGELNSVESVKAQLDQNLKAATQIMKQADDIALKEKTFEKMKMAVSMYAHAGKLFQDAMQTYTKLGPNQVNPADVQLAKTSMERCIAQIQGIKQKIQTGAIPAA